METGWNFSLMLLFSLTLEHLGKDRRTQNLHEVSKIHTAKKRGCSNYMIDIQSHIQRILITLPQES